MILQARSILISFCLVSSLTACTVVQFGEPYDQNIDDQLNAYHKQATEFIKSMEQVAGTKAGRYNSEAARKFYARADANLQNIQVQADVLSTRKCPVQYVEKLATRFLSPQLRESTVSQQAPGNAAPLLLPATESYGGNCISIVVHGVVLAQADLELDHKEENKLSRTVALLNQEQINAAVRVALTALRAKKY